MSLDQYFTLTDKERQIITSAAKTGDNPLTRQLLSLYFPKLSAEEIVTLMKDLRGLP